MRRIIPVLTLLATPLAVSGCGSSDTIWVTGKLLKGGAVYTPPAGQKVGVTLYALEVTDGSGKAVAVNEPFTAELNPADGTFTVPGPDGRGIHPGKYRVAIVQRMKRDALPASKGSSPAKRAGETPINRETDMLKNQFGPATSPIVRELKTSGEISIDLAKPDATTEPPKSG